MQNHRTIHGIRLLLVMLVVCWWHVGCAKRNALTIYTSVDRDYSEPIIAEFMSRNPEMEVQTVYDSELTKTTGLFNRLLHEKHNPQCDVFWNSEILRTVQLKKENLLTPYDSPSAADIPNKYKDLDRFWTGFSVRARVMIINTDLVPDSETPASVPALGLRKYAGKTGMAIPEFGTTALHMAALFAKWGEAGFLIYMREVKNNNLKLLPGNATVRDEVARGSLAYGLTDTDDAFAALAENKPVRMIFLDQDGDGTLVIPNTVALIKNGPNPENGKAFIDYLLSPEIEQKLAESRAKQIPVRSTVSRPDDLPDLAAIKVFEVDYDALVDKLNPCLESLRIVFPQ